MGECIRFRQRLRPFGAAPECHGPFIDAETLVLFKLIGMSVRVASWLLEVERGGIRRFCQIPLLTAIPHYTITATNPLLGKGAESDCSWGFDAFWRLSLIQS